MHIWQLLLNAPLPPNDPEPVRREPNEERTRRERMQQVTNRLSDLDRRQRDLSEVA